jgi:hypothetical protein
MKGASRLPSGLALFLQRLISYYSAARDRYEDAVLRTGLPIGTPQEALDTVTVIVATGQSMMPQPRTLR